MIVDASALLALVLDEADARRFAEAMAGAPTLRMSAVNWFEAAMVVDRRGDPFARNRFDDFVNRFGIMVDPVDRSHAELARNAWEQFGRGRHKAKLNFGDCLAYGFAKGEGEPLLFKGNGFSETDIEPALKD